MCPANLGNFCRYVEMTGYSIRGPYSLSNEVRFPSNFCGAQRASLERLIVLPNRLKTQRSRIECIGCFSECCVWPTVTAYFLPCHPPNAYLNSTLYNEALRYQFFISLGILEIAKRINSNECVLCLSSTKRTFNLPLQWFA